METEFSLRILKRCCSTALRNLVLQIAPGTKSKAELVLVPSQGTIFFFFFFCFEAGGNSFPFLSFSFQLFLECVQPALFANLDLSLAQKTFFCWIFE